jgi:hypothetical protein
MKQKLHSQSQDRMLKFTSRTNLGLQGLKFSRYILNLIFFIPNSWFTSPVLNLPRQRLEVELKFRCFTYLLLCSSLGVKRSTVKSDEYATEKLVVGPKENYNNWKDVSVNLLGLKHNWVLKKWCKLGIGACIFSKERLSSCNSSKLLTWITRITSTSHVFEYFQATALFMRITRSHKTMRALGIVGTYLEKDADASCELSIVSRAIYAATCSWCCPRQFSPSAHACKNWHPSHEIEPHRTLALNRSLPFNYNIAAPNSRFGPIRPEVGHSSGSAEPST